MATYTENYNLKMPSGQDAPDVEDFNTNAEIIDTVLKAHSDNTADEYSPDETYTAGRLVIKNNALWKAKQDINVAEAWTPAHWTQTTLAAEFSAVNSRIHKIDQDLSVSAQTSYFYTGLSVTIPANSYFVLTARCSWGSSRPVWVGIASDSESDTSQYAEGIGEKATVSCTYSGFVEEETTFYVWAKWSAAGDNAVLAKGFYVSGSRFSKINVPDP